MNRFQKRYKEFSGQEQKEVSIPQVIRINTLKIGEHELLDRLSKKGVKVKKIDYLKFAYEVVDAPFSVGSTPEYLQGYYYVQGAASQIPVHILNPQPGETVLDMCAAPGSKTTQAAQWMENKGMLIALDSEARRLARLRNNCMRCGVTNTAIYHKDGRYFEWEKKFDKILVDAPCSGNYTQEENWFEKRTFPDLIKKAGVQRQLLQNAVDLLKMGGELVYSTCSLEPEEDEEVVQWAMENLGLELLDIDLGLDAPGLTSTGKKTFDPSLSKTLRLWPSKTGTEGFFVARLKKTSERE